VGHAAVTVSASVGGYFAGKRAAETVYDYVTKPGFKR